MAVKKMSISSYLGEGELDSVKGKTVFVGFPKELNFHREVLEEKHNKTAIEAALSQILDVGVTLQFIPCDRKMKEADSENLPLSKEELKKKEPIINTALDMFGGSILRSTKKA